MTLRFYIDRVKIKVMSVVQGWIQEFLKGGSMSRGRTAGERGGG